MTDKNMAGTGNEELQRKVDQEREVSENLMHEQREVRDDLTKKALQAQHERYQEWLSGKAEDQNQLMPAGNANELPPAPREPLATTGTPEQIQAGRQALQAYQGAGFIVHRDNSAFSGGAQATAADHALSQERAFRDRQQQLADKITDPKTSLEQRERLELQKAAEYHNHHAESWNQVAELQRQLGYPDKSISEAQRQTDHYKEQAALVANQLHQYDQKNDMVPKEVLLGLKKENHSTIHSQIQGRDRELNALSSAKSEQESHQARSTNPAFDRAMQRREASAQRHNGTEPSAWLKEQITEASTRENQIEQQRTEALGKKSEMERHPEQAR